VRRNNSATYGDVVVGGGAVSGSGAANDVHGIVAMVSVSAHHVAQGVKTRRRPCSSPSSICRALFDIIRAVATRRCERVFIEDEDDDVDDDGSPVTRPRRAPHPIVAVVVVVDSIVTNELKFHTAPQSDADVDHRPTFDDARHGGNRRGTTRETSRDARGCRSSERHRRRRR